MKRVEICRLGGNGVYNTERVAVAVFTAGVCRRTIEVTWDGMAKELVFTARVPITKRMALTVLQKEKTA